LQELDDAQRGSGVRVVRPYARCLRVLQSEPLLRLPQTPVLLAERPAASAVVTSVVLHDARRPDELVVVRR